MDESLPNITGSFAYSAQTAIEPTGCFSNGGTYNYASNRTYKGIGGFDFDASLSSSVYQDDAHVTPLSCVTAFYIKY